jgi:hypothetical protein
MSKSRLSHSLLLLCAFGICAHGCDIPPPAIIKKSLNEANQYLVRIAKDDYKIDLKVIPLQNTIYIYVPMDAPLIEIKAKEGPPAPFQPAAEKREVHFLDGKLASREFHFSYDISPVKQYPPEYLGHQSQYSETYQKFYRYILTSLSRAYADVEQLPDSGKFVHKVKGDIDYANKNSQEQKDHKRLVHNYVSTDHVPSFFILIIADVKNGLWTQTIFYFPDLYRGLFDRDFQEEYVKRTVSDQVKGSVKIIGDYAGDNILLEEMTWENFLTKQILQRIQYKYGPSSFPPEGPDEQIIFNIVRETLKMYPFRDFDGARLTDLRNQQEYNHPQAEILK